MSKSELSSVPPMGAKKYIQFVSRFHGFFRRKRKPSVEVTNEYGSNEKKKVHGEVANGDFCPRKVEGLFYLLRLMRAAQRLLPWLATHGGKR